MSSRCFSVRALLSAMTAIGCIAASPAFAQLPQIRLDAIGPVGAKAGSELDVVVKAGTDLDELDTLIFSHAGIKATPKMQDVAGKQQPVTNTFVVSVAADVPPGNYEVNASGLYGVSNPRTFVVSNKEEIAEKESNNDAATAQEIPLGVVVNGQSGVADYDFYKFTGKAGQRVIVSIQARRIDSQMDAIIECYDANGRRLGYGSQNVRQDPMVDVTLPADGEYIVKVFDAEFKGGNNHFYRLTAQVGPYIDFILPPAGQPGTTGSFTVYGRNLPGGQPSDMTIQGHKLQKLNVQIALPADGSKLNSRDYLSPPEFSVDGFSYSVKSDVATSNPYLIHFASAPVTLEQEPNDESAKAQKITIPSEYAGQFQSPGDVDYVEFEAKAGAVYYIEAFGERHASFADPYLILEQITKKADGTETVKRLTALDDDATNIGGTTFNSQTDDPVYQFKVPADGIYRVSARDRFFESRGDASLVYRIAIQEESPDFRLVAVPSSPGAANAPAVAGILMLRRGDNVSLDVYAFRKDGYNGAIDVWAENLPNGVKVSACSIGPGQATAPLVFTAAEDCKIGYQQIKILGKAKIENPAKARELTQVTAAVKPAADAIAKLQDTATKAKAPADKARTDLKAAQDALAKKTDDAGLKAKVAAAQKAADTAIANEKKANDALTAGKKKLADANAAVKRVQDELNASAKDVTREARAATIAWNGSTTAPSVIRTTDAIGLSVIKEEAPFQISNNVGRVIAYQSRQILVPIKATKRVKIDKDITLAFTGVPKNSQLQVANDKITKDETEKVLRIFVANNAPESVYTIYLTAACQISYIKNPERLERAKKELELATKAVTETAAAAKKSTADKAAATKQAADDANKAKLAQTARDTAAKAVATAEAAAKSAKDDKAKADAAANLNKAKAALAAADKTLADAQAAAKASADAKTKSEADSKTADDKSKAATAAKVAADKEVKDATAVAKPANKNFTPVSDSIVIEVRKAPVQLTAAVPGGGALKRGSKIEVKVTVKRVNGFTGPVTLSLPLPPGVKGLSAPAVTIPADKSDGVFVINAAGDATEGQLKNMVIQGMSNFDGEQAAVDVVVALKVAK